MEPTTQVAPTDVTPSSQGVAPTPPVETTPSPAPVVETPVPTPAVIEAPKVEVEAPKTGDEAKPAEAPKTLLGEAVKPELKLVENKPEIKPEEKEGSKSDEPAPLPTYTEIKLPEGADATRVGGFIQALGEFERSTKADHAEVQKFGQMLVDKHLADIATYAEQTKAAQKAAETARATEWREAFEKDPTLGGNQRNTTLKAANEFIRTHGGNAEQQAEFYQLMETTGLGNNPSMLRLLAQASRSMSEGKPLPGTKPVQQNVSKVAKRYGNS